MWGKIIVGIIGLVGTYLLVKHWNDIVYEISSWARTHNYHGIIKVICEIEEIRAGIRELTFKFLGEKGKSTLQENPPVITTRTIEYEELPPEFQYIGTREHEIPILEE